MNTEEEKSELVAWKVKNADLDVKVCEDINEN